MDKYYEEVCHLQIYYLMVRKNDGSITCPYLYNVKVLIVC